jgi:hypothetical protein
VTPMETRRRRRGRKEVWGNTISCKVRVYGWSKTVTSNFWTLDVSIQLSNFDDLSVKAPVLDFALQPGYREEKLNTVSLWKCWPGFNVVVGKLGWFGESGKCCVSRHRAVRLPYATPPLPLIMPSRKLPV